MCTNSEIDFCINILKALSLNETSIVFSPFMILKDLTAVSSGFDDEGAKELTHVFGNGILTPEKAQHYSNVVNLSKDFNKDENTSKLLFPSSMFLSDDHILSSSYIDLLHKLEINYDQLNFKDGKNSAEKISNFISQNTENNLTEIISEKNINSEGNLIIANGLYFFGEWETPFEQYYGFFWLSDESYHLRRKERMMRRTNYNEVLNLTEGETWRCLGIPFKGRKSWLHIILPKKQLDLATVLEEFNADLLQKCIVKNPSGEIEVAIPIFQMVNKFCFMEILPKLGINNIFEEVPLSNEISKKPVKLDNIFHAARININQFNLAEYPYSDELTSDDREPEVTRSFVAFHPFIYFVTLVENDVNDLKTLLLMGTFY